jgi:hypothetical protein
MPVELWFDFISHTYAYMHKEIFDTGIYEGSLPNRQNSG